MPRLCKASSGESGQATLEAACLIPLFCLGALMLIQPAVILYDRMIMQAAASDACRVLETLGPGHERSVEEFILFRLESIPRSEAFHAGEWDIELSGDESSETATARISHKLRLLPFIDLGAGLAGLSDGEGMLSMEASASLGKDEWLASCDLGLDPSSWVSRWEDKV